MNGYDKLARYYDTDKSPVWQEVRDLLSAIKPGVAVLDIGCATGRVRQVLPDNTDYTGLDNSPELLEVARRHHQKDKFVEADARQLPFGDNIFGVILLIATVHHFFNKPDRIKILTEARRVLKSGGKIYLTVWNLNRPKFCRQWRGWRRVFIPNQHDAKIIRQYYAYTLPGLKKELAAAGFKVNKINYSNNHWLKSRNIVALAQK